MSRINIEEYKNHLINYYRYEYDNAENQRKKRMLLLANKYSDEFLEKIILGTYNDKRVTIW